MDILELIAKLIIPPITLIYILVLSKFRYSRRGTLIGSFFTCIAITLLNLGVVSALSPFFAEYVAIEPLLRTLTYVELVLAALFLTRQPFSRLMLVSFVSFILIYIAQVIGISVRVYTAYHPAELFVRLPLNALGLYIVCLVRSRWRWFANSVDKKTWWQLWIITALITLAFTFLTSVPAPLPNSPQNILPSIVLSGTGIAIFMAFFYIFEGLQAQHQIEQALMLKDFQTAALELQTETSAQNLESFTLFRHDLGHIALLLRVCLDSGHFDEARRLLATVDSNISSSPHNHAEEPLIGNRLLDSTLSHYCAVAKESGISTSLSVGVASAFVVSQAELAVALANALECAIITCRPLDEGKRRIHITGHQQTRSYFLEVASTCPPQIEIDTETALPIGGGSVVSTGWESITRFAKKNNMRLRYQRDDDWLVLQLQI